jgi:hypothetical protein
MSATYTNDPTNRPIDAVRFYVNDKDCIPETDAALSDEEIQFLLNTNSSTLFAAADAANAIGAKYADDPESKDVGDFKLSYADGGRSTTYGGLAKSLRLKAAKRVGGKIYAGGISHADKRAAESDPDRVQPSITIGMDDNVTADTPVSDF